MLEAPCKIRLMIEPRLCCNLLHRFPGGQQWSSFPQSLRSHPFPWGLAELFEKVPPKLPLTDTALFRQLADTKMCVGRHLVPVMDMIQPACHTDSFDVPRTYLLYGDFRQIFQRIFSVLLQFTPGQNYAARSAVFAGTSLNLKI